MDASRPITEYLKFKDFLAQNPALSDSTVRRRIKAGELAHIQPGGPNTEILIPVDALQRLEKNRAVKEVEFAPNSSTKIPGPAPRWKK